MLLPLVLVALLLYYYWKKERKDKKIGSNPPPLPYKLPIIGHAHLFIGDSTHPWKLAQWMSSQVLKNGDCMTLSLGYKSGCLITDPDDCLTASNACLVKDYYYGFAESWLGNGFLTAEIPTWKKHRKMLTSVFSLQVLNGFIDVFNQRSRMLVATWSDRKGHFIHSRDISLNSLESLCQNALGIKMENEVTIKEEYENALEDVFYILTKRFKNVWLHSDFLYNMTSLKKQEDCAVKILHRMTEAVLQKRKQMQNQEFGKVISSDTPKSFIDVIIELAKGNPEYTDQDLREEVDNIIFSGHDTISTVLTFVLVVLGSYQEVQDKVYEEIINVFGNTDRNVEKDDYVKLKYLEAVIKETLRMYPIVPIIARRVDSDVQLKNYTMKAGDSCFLLYYGVCRHQVWGPDVHEFKPERWLSPDTLPKNSSAFVGFSIGRRACVGKNYAIMSMKTTLVHIIRNYKITSNINNMVLKLDTVLKPLKGHEICLEKRKEFLFEEATLHAKLIIRKTDVTSVCLRPWKLKSLRNVRTNKEQNKCD